METLIIQPTKTAEWHALVEEAEKTSSICLNEDLESYLVFLLMRFVDKPEILQSILANDYLLSFTQLKTERQITLQEIGDKCLLFSGLFPGQAKKRRVKTSYYIQLGQSAYDSLAHFPEFEFCELYSELCAHFVGLMDILQSMRGQTSKSFPILTLIPSRPFNPLEKH